MRRWERQDGDGLFILQDASLAPPEGAARVSAERAVWRVLGWSLDPLSAPGLTQLVDGLSGGRALPPNTLVEVVRAELEALLLLERLVLYVLRVALGGAPAPQPQPRPQPPQPQPKAITTLDGVVTDGGSNPLARATVRMNGRTVTADDQGRFDFGEVPPGNATLTATFEGFEGTLTTSVAAGTANHVTVRITNPTSVAITRSPKKIIHAYNESITFTATVQPQPAPAGAVYHWFVDGVEDTSQRTRTFTKRFTPAATAAERRKEYTVSVRVVAATAQMQHVRVAQNANVGTANVAQSNAGLDTYGWTDTNPVLFDSPLSAAQETYLQGNYPLTRQVSAKTLPNGTTQYGRLQFTSGSFTWDMNTEAYIPDRPAAIVVVRSSAFNWNKEELDSMLQHETRHCEHYKARGTSTNIWRRLFDLGFAANYSPFTEMFGYYEYLQSTTVSYKFLLDYHAFDSFIREYNGAKTALAGMSGATKTDARSLVMTCYNGVAFSELREAASEGWDHHIDAPP